VAGGANFHLDILHGGTGFDHVSAGAGNFGHLVFGMNFVFHVNPPIFVQLPWPFAVRRFKD